MLSAEDVAYWYLRLNGFMTLRNFLVHGDSAKTSRTDIDILGVRFPFRQEHLAHPMQDDGWIQEKTKTIVVFCEAKKGAYDINNSWRQENRKIMESFLALVGCIDSEQERLSVARDLYDRGYSDRMENFFITTLLINHDPHEQVKHGWPQAPRIDLAQALKFVRNRFSNYSNIKSEHQIWEASGHQLWALFKSDGASEENFLRKGLRELGI